LVAVGGDQLVDDHIVLASEGADTGRGTATHELFGDLT